MYCGHARLCVCVCVCLSAAVRPHYCTDPDLTRRRSRGCPLVVHYWADLQSVHGLRCYGKITRSQNVSEYVLVLALCLVVTYLQFPIIQTCFSLLSVCRPRPASHAHFRHRQPSGLNSSIDSTISVYATHRVLSNSPSELTRNMTSDIASSTNNGMNVHSNSCFKVDFPCEPGLAACPVTFFLLQLWFYISFYISRES